MTPENQRIATSGEARQSLAGKMRLNSFDEWTTLREVVVGRAENYAAHGRDLSFELFFFDNIHRGTSWYYPRLSVGGDATSNSSSVVRTPIDARYVEELTEDLEGLVESLEALSVRVLRPMPLPSDTATVQTLGWEAAVAPPLNLRDNTLILGDEIIETPPMIRSRYFETQFLKPIFLEYARGGARWTVMPRPLMTDASFDTSYADEGSMGGPTEVVERPRKSSYDVGFEPMIDAAQCLRLGEDIVVNVSTANHAFACDLLERHLKGRFRIHRVDRLSDSHLDSMVLALRAGTLLVRDSRVREMLPAPLQKWEVIVAPEVEVNRFPEYEDDLLLASPYIDLNVLSVDSETVVVNEAAPELSRLLERHGFTTVPVRHRHRRLFGGGFHCFTLDMVRDGGKENYLA
jgi:glycine amidinotransferase